MTATSNGTFISISEAAAKIGISRERFSALVRGGRVKGAKKIGQRVWMIPADFTVERYPVGRPKAR
jgi:predicted DNA-binding protein (UPF0251 family)